VKGAEMLVEAARVDDQLQCSSCGVGSYPGMPGTP
jgi:hypothetical protein